MNVRWLETSAEVYAVIYARHREQLTVHGTCTRTEISSLGDRLILTEWGLKSSDAPLIMYEERGEEKEVRYFIACFMEES
jgi:hypothetical protein